MEKKFKKTKSQAYASTSNKCIFTKPSSFYCHDDPATVEASQYLHQSYQNLIPIHIDTQIVKTEQASIINKLYEKISQPTYNYYFSHRACPQYR